MNNHPNHPPAVANLQRYLRQLSYDEPTIPPPPVDGIFESQTGAALREFQRLRGFPVTGSADRETWDRLYADYRASLAQNSPPRPILIFDLDPAGYVMRPGTESFAVATLRYMLRELQHDYIGLSDLSDGSLYDDDTANAVRKFQEQNTLPVTGETDKDTWNAIADRYNMLFSTTSDQ